MDEFTSQNNEIIDLEKFSANKKTFVFTMYCKLGSFEQHLDTITTKYKYLALSWMLACYASIGFLLSNEVTHITFNPLFAVIVAGIIGIIGVVLLWNLDLNVYTRFWAIAFIEQVRMERKFDFLLMSRNIELLVDQDKERIVAQGLLYMIATSLLMLTVGVVTIYLYLSLSFLILVIIGLAFLVGNFIVCFLMYRVMKISQIKLTQTISSLENSSFF